MSTLISADAAHAFWNNKDFRRGNTEVTNGLNGCGMLLFDNLIASTSRKQDFVVITMDMCGWGTRTTRERLNAIFDIYGAPFFIEQYKREQILVWCPPFRDLATQSYRYHKINTSEAFNYRPELQVVMFADGTTFPR